MSRPKQSSCSECGAVDRWLGPDHTGNYTCQQCGAPRFKAATVPLTNEHDAARESSRAQAAIIERKREADVRADTRRKIEGKPTLNLDEEAKRIAAAHAKAMQGRAGVNFFPRDKCPVCGECSWLDEEKGRVQPWHDSEKHGVTPGAKIKKDATRIDENVQRQAAHQRARRSQGDND